MSKLNAQIEHYIPLIHQVLESGKSKYFFTNVLYHQLLISKNQFAEANRNYVLEIIYRFHAASLITLRRNLAWIGSIQLAQKHALYFSFCSALRGLIESAADSFYSLRYVPQNIATYFNPIKKCIEKKESKKLYLFKELEDWGIHFLEAGKYEDKELEKDHFKAKPMVEYLKSIDTESALKPVYPLYQELCQITHPSGETTYLFFKSKEDNFFEQTVKSLRDYFPKPMAIRSIPSPLRYYSQPAFSYQVSEGVLIKPPQAATLIDAAQHFLFAQGLLLFLER